MRPARRLGGDVVVVGAPTQPAAVAIPVTNPTRESWGGGVEKKEKSGLWERTEREKVT